MLHSGSELLKQTLRRRNFSALIPYFILTEEPLLRINVLTLGLYEARGAPEAAALAARGSLLLAVD